MKIRQAKKIVDKVMDADRECDDLNAVMEQLFGESLRMRWHKSERKAWRVYERHAIRGKK